MFIRAKKIKNNDYAYLVVNRWKKGRGARQKVGKYLGKILYLEKTIDRQFIQSLRYPDAYLKKTRPKQMLQDFMRFKLSDFGFAQHQKRLMVMVKDDISIDLSKLKVTYRDKPIVLGINNDFLCDLTLRNLMNFKTDRDFDGAGLELAKAFVSTGISVEEEFFIHLFKKVFKPQGQSYIY